MEKCGWLTVKQLVVFQTTLMVHKTVSSGKSYYMNSRLSSDFSYRTRQHSTGSIRLDQTYRYKSELPKCSFRYRGAHDYNAIPPDIRSSRNMNTFKPKLKRWVKMNINPD